MMKERDEERGSAARKLQLERLMEKVYKEIDETSGEDKLKLTDRYMELRKEYQDYYND